MKVGDLVRKEKGMGQGESGIVIKISNPGSSSKNGHEILSVLVDGRVRNWASHLVKVINV